jgi:plastocyanin
MRSVRTGLIAMVAALAAAGCGSSEPGPPSGAGSADAMVTTKLLSFEPKKLTVTAGTTVTWDVGDAIAHTVTTGTFTVGGDGLRTDAQPDGTIDLPLAKGKSIRFTFDKPGTYIYYCSVHKGMHGEVNVTR